MFRIVKRSQWITIIAIVVIGGIGVVLVESVLNWHSSIRVSSQGGDVWDTQHSVGIRAGNGVLAQATTFSLHKGGSQPAVAADSLVDVINDPVDITPDHSVGNNSTQIMFKMPATMPTNVDCTKKDTNRPRSICNAGIEVYNTTLQGWVPLETHIERGNILVATAPHYSEYRSVWSKIGDYVVDVGTALKVHLDNDTTPDAIGWQASKAFFKQFYNNLTGTFDTSKMEQCEKSADQDYTIDFQLPNQDIQPCVIKKGDGVKLLVGDHLALPIAVTSSITNGVTPDEGNQAEVTTALRDKIAQKIQQAMGGGSVLIVSGLDTASFTLDENKLNDDSGQPVSVIPMSSRISWPAVAGDYLTTFMSLFFKSERVAEQVDKLVDAADCMATGFQKIQGMASGEIPGQLAEILKACAIPAGVDAGLFKKLGVPEIVGTFVKSTKLIAETFQIGEDISRNWRTGQGMGDATFTVSNPNRALLGQWVDTCAGSDDTLDILGQGDDSWIRKDLGPDGSVTASYLTHFKIVNEEGHIKMHVESTTLPDLQNGQLAPISLQPMDASGFGPFLIIDQNYEFFRPSYNGPSPC